MKFIVKVKKILPQKEFSFGFDGKFDVLFAFDVFLRSEN